MSDLGDRLIILLLAATVLGSLLLGFGGAFVVAEVPRWAQLASLGVIVLAILVLLAVTWAEFDLIDIRS